MRKLTGWIIIIFCSMFLIVFATVLIITIPNILNDDDFIRQYKSFDAFSSIVGFVGVTTLLIIGLQNGIKRLKKTKPMELIPFLDILDIRFKGQIRYEDYRNLIFGLTFKKPTYLIFIGIFLLFCLSYLSNVQAMNNFLSENYFILIFLGVAILSPLFTLIQIKKIYKSSKVLNEPIEYQINNDSVHLKSDTVDSIQYWNHFYKIKETKCFYLLYQGKAVATLIEKSMLNSADNAKFKIFLKSLNIIRE
jgi:hypothetical protein